MKENDKRGQLGHKINHREPCSSNDLILGVLNQLNPEVWLNVPLNGTIISHFACIEFVEVLHNRVVRTEPEVLLVSELGRLQIDVVLDRLSLVSGEMERIDVAIVKVVVPCVDVDESVLLVIRIVVVSQPVLVQRRVVELAKGVTRVDNLIIEAIFLLRYSLRELLSCHAAGGDYHSGLADPFDLVLNVLNLRRDSLGQVPWTQNLVIDNFLVLKLGGGKQHPWEFSLKLSLPLGRDQLLIKSVVGF